MSIPFRSLHTERDLVHRGLDRCDLCGAPLAPSEQLAGVCKTCKAAITAPTTRRVSRR